MLFRRSSITATIAALNILTARATSGKATWFNTGLGSCGQMSTDDQLVVALSPSEISPASCFKTITLRAHDGTQVVAQVTDKCPGCAATDVDLSPAAFMALNKGNLGAGNIGIEWFWNN